MEKIAGFTNERDLSNEILTVDLLSEFLRCHPSTIYRLVKMGTIPHFRLGSDLRFDKSLIKTWIRERSNSKPERRRHMAQ
ncbi:MAG: helix-turn-helix domain-containing protein [Candidatus Binataceae bacterium]